MVLQVHKMDIKGKKVKMSIWDTAGQERFRTITSSYYRGAQGIILVYDVSNRETFDALPRWFSELETYVSDAVVKIVVGNKVDKVRLWPFSQISLHSDNGILSFSLSLLHAGILSTSILC